jgi:phosphatidylserine/phosphatidylglycerophosphate/cardiolipin synthase-like enzyme
MWSRAAQDVPGLKVHVRMLVVPDLPDAQDWKKANVYVHAKLMLIDNTFMTLGSSST